MPASVSPAAQSAILPTYARADIAFERGEGAWLITTEGERYLDFAGGIAVNVLGHSHPRLVAALTEQASKLWHTSNLYRMPLGDKFAAKLCELTFAETMFFTNSGAEANECAFKMARKYQAVSGHPEKFRIITFEGAFHGRTLATIAATGNKKYLEGFGPAVEGFDQVPFGDFEAVKKAITLETAAIIIEPVQGEGGIREVPTEFLRALRALCDEKGLLLILDEIQCGVGRTGKFFAHEWAGVTPDIMSIAKGIGGGFPMGACLATKEAAKGMTAGTHGSTYGGNPLAMAVGLAVVDEVAKPEFLDQVQMTANRFRQRLAELCDLYPEIVNEVRGKGLIAGIRCVVPNGDLVAAARAEKLLTVGAGDNVVRFVPPLNISEADVQDAFDRLDRACRAVKAKLPAALRSAAE